MNSEKHDKEKEKDQKYSLEVLIFIIFHWTAFSFNFWPY